MLLPARAIRAQGRRHVRLLLDLLARSLPAQWHLVHEIHRRVGRPTPFVSGRFQRAVRYAARFGPRSLSAPLLRRATREASTQTEGPPIHFGEIPPAWHAIPEGIPAAWHARPEEVPAFVMGDPPAPRGDAAHLEGILEGLLRAPQLPPAIPAPAPADALLDLFPNEEDLAFFNL